LAGFNKVLLIGNLTRDPELRYTPQGTAVADLRIAVTTVRGKSGAERKEETLFIDCTVWERQAETCSEYLSKGRSVLVEGRLIEDQWQDKETGERRSRIKVYVQSVQFLGGRDGAPSGRFDAGASDRFDASAKDDRAASRRTPAKPGEARPAPARSQPDDAFGAASAGGRDAGPGGDDIPF
jgi:single-strand DNA-binding protein